MKVIPEEKIKLLDELFSNAGKVCIAGHQHPDGDAVGSILALSGYLKGMRGTGTYTCVPDAPAGTLEFLFSQGGKPHILEERRRAVAKNIAECDLVVCLDCSSLERTGDLRDILIRKDCPMVLIDHHLSPKEEQFALVFSDTEVSSASELLYHILLSMPDVAGDASRLPADVRTALLTGMTTDTNNFANSVFPTTLKMAGDLMAAGTDREEILSHLYHEYREERVRLMAFLLRDRMKITPEGVAYMVLSGKRAASYGIREGELEGLVNIPLSIARVRMSIFIKQDRDIFRVSIRSKKGTSANGMAVRYFNGGGHENAAGGRLIRQGATGSCHKVAAYVEKVCSVYFGNE